VIDSSWDEFIDIDLAILINIKVIHQLIQVLFLQQDLTTFSVGPIKLFNRQEAIFVFIKTLEFLF